jgi:hypothetical protein
MRHDWAVRYCFQSAIARSSAYLEISEQDILEESLGMGSLLRSAGIGFVGGLSVTLYRGDVYSGWAEGQ